MLLNRAETLLMNNPVRAAIQRHFEARRLLELGGPLPGGTALEIGCGRGVGTELILDVFGADRVDAIDLDPAMVERIGTITGFLRPITGKVTTPAGSLGLLARSMQPNGGTETKSVAKPTFPGGAS
jgi:hypothetical protein